MKENATSGGRAAIACLNAKRYKPLLKLLGRDWGINSSGEYDGRFTARNKVTGQEIRGTTFDKFELAVQRAAAGRDNARKPPQPQPKARAQRRTQARPAAVRPSWPPRTWRERREELMRHQMDIGMREFEKHKADVRRDGLRLLRERPWLSMADLYLYFP